MISNSINNFRSVRIMIFYITVIVCVCVCAICVHYRIGRTQRVPSGLKDIPTETGAPVLGVVNRIGQSLCNYLLNLSHKHGPIYRIKFGIRDIVVLNTYEYIKAALVDNGDTFSGRCKGLNYTIGAKDSGLLFIHGNVWSEQRSFILRSLKDFGIGRAKSVEVVQDECIHLLEDLERLKGKSVNVFHFLSLYSINVISKFLLNKRFTRDEPELKMFEKYMTAVATQHDSISDLVLMFPFIERNECLMRFILKITPRKALLDDCHDMFRKQIEKHSKNLDFNSDGHDLTDMFLINQYRLQVSSGNVRSFTEMQLVRNILELMGSGYDCSASLLWGFLFMAMYPDVQNKVYEEIIKKIGNERLITAVDKMFLTYTQAVMDEVLRLGSPDPLALFHRALHDVSVNGYYVPRDTLIVPNLLACHLNPETWVNPLQFHPNRFLIRDDNGEMKYKPREDLIPFSVGKRRCMGESLGRLVYFIFFTSIIRRFRVVTAIKDMKFYVLHSNDGIIRTPKIQDFVFMSRQ